MTANFAIQYLKRKPLFVLFAILFFAKGFSQDFDVNHCCVDVYISEKGYFDVVESYDLNFTAQKHGIYRDFRLKYNLLNEVGKKEKRRIKIKEIDVPNHKYETTPGFIQNLSNNLRIKIGDIVSEIKTSVYCWVCCTYFRDFFRKKTSFNIWCVVVIIVAATESY